MRLFFYILPCLASLFLTGCNALPEQQASAESCIIDSFTVKGIRSLYELYSLKPINDSTLVGHSHETNEAALYVRQQGTKVYSFKSATTIALREFPMLFAPMVDKTYLVIDRDRNFYHLDTAFHPLSPSRNFPHQMSYMANNYMLFRGNFQDLVQLGDTLILRYGRTNMDVAKGLMEDCLVELIYSPDTIRYLRTYFPQRIDLAHNYQQILWTYHQQRIDIVFSGIDTIYSYDRLHKTYSQHAIHNSDFKAPQEFDRTKFGTAEYTAYRTKYFLHNFDYQEFYFDPSTEHYVLTYQTPIVDTFKTRLPTEYDKQKYVMTLDKNYQPLKTYHEEKQYWQEVFFIMGKGVARTLLQRPDSFSEMKFYVFQF